MKAIGNYRQSQASAPIVERRLAQVVVFQGPRAYVRTLDGDTHTMAAESLRRLSMREGDTFVLVAEYQGKRVLAVRVERQGEARPNVPMEKERPKVMVRSGMKVTTRR